MFEARRAALEADIVVVNHHLLLADLALKEDGFGDLLPSVDAVILDEAHQLPDLASEFFGVSCREPPDRCCWPRDLRTQLQDRADSMPDWSSRWSAHWPTAWARLDARNANWPGASWAIRRGAACEELRRMHSTELLELVAAARMPSVDSQTCRAARGASSRRALSLALRRGRTLHESHVDGARTATMHARGFQLRLLPYDISGRFSALLRQHHSAWIFTSATLAVGEDFGHFAAGWGCEAAATVRYESPFDYARQALLYLPRRLAGSGKPGYTAAVVGCRAPADRGLRAAGRFCSSRVIARCDRCGASCERLLPAQWPLLVQGRAPREQLLRRFRASGRAVLLGTASFWEGVDVQGPALRLVIIDKLPFASPEDPVVRARIEYLESQGASAFRDYQLPEAVLALKQGVGRLIRSEEDRGVVMICDPRLRGRSYGRVFLSSLPPMAAAKDIEAALVLLRELGEAAQPRGASDALGAAAPAAAPA